MGEGSGGLRDATPLSDPLPLPASGDSPILSASHVEVEGKGASAEAESAPISLDDLRRAFEDAMHLSREPSDDPDTSTQDGRYGVDRFDSADRPAETIAVPLTPASILEAMLFVGSPLQASLPLTVLEDILHGMSASDIEKTIAELNDSYQRRGHPWHIVRDGDAFSLQLSESMELTLDRLQSSPKDTALSQNAIDCLSLIAYRPGISKGELESLWRQNAGATLSYLLKRGLVRIQEQDGSDTPRYFTTERFLEISGLQSLEDLPQGEEL